MIALCLKEDSSQVRSSFIDSSRPTLFPNTGGAFKHKTVHFRQAFAAPPLVLATVRVPAGSPKGASNMECTSALAARVCTFVFCEGGEVRAESREMLSKSALNNESRGGAQVWSSGSRSDRPAPIASRSTSLGSTDYRAPIPGPGAPTSR